MLTSLVTLALSAAITDPEPATTRIKTDIIAGEWHDDDRITIQGYSDKDWFVFSSDTLAARERFYGLIGQAFEEEGMVELILSPQEASLWGEDKVIAYPICVARYQNRVVRSSSGCVSEAASANLTPIQQIAVSRAAYLAGKQSDGASSLAPLLAQDDLYETVMILALMTRADSLESLGNRLEAGQARDEAYVEALRLYEQLSDLEPDNAWHATDAAGMRMSLGDYEGARAAYLAHTERFPEAKEFNDVSLASIERHLGNNEGALAILDAIVPDREIDEETGRGLRFHYHRGRTLISLGRYEEAEQEFNEGLKSQASYSWAYQKRGCAIGNGGDLPRALEDVRKSRDLFSDNLSESDSPAVAYNRARLDAIVAQIEADIEAGRSTPSADICDGFWSENEGRERSPLLDTLE